MNKRVLSNDIILESISEMLAEGREVVMTPKGSSMHPFIRGDVDSVALKKKDTVAPGDIVLAKIGDRFIMHRVMSVKEDSVILMGDGNVRGTEQCTPGDIRGTVVSVIKPSGRRKTPGKGRIWKALRPVRRYLLAIYRKLI
ncbi:MAG: hypothetical protein J5520_01635 [Bacteroidales bacterium]|nr:hypothetical protein [Bacteroidales bacterium]